MKNYTCDILIIGSGAAGSYAAMEAAKLGADVVVITKTPLLSGSTRWAQGGVAFPSDLGDISSHLDDTLRAGRGLSNPEVSSMILGDALNVLEDLLLLGMKFDDTPALEGGHSRPRVLSVNGDESGLHLLRFLHSKLPEEVTILENHFANNLLVEDGRVIGATAWTNGVMTMPVAIRSNVTIIATGGIGQIYKVTTNPKESTGDGIALAYRAGAKVRDLELVQFHPTVLPNGALISEACRGEGAVLINGNGQMFMEKYDPAAELAPRDVVARAIFLEEQSTGAVYLDLSEIEDLQIKFPTVYQSITALGVDPLKDPVQIHPAAHYLMGGISTDENGTSTVPNLYVAGEAASTGFHGANRLASNSLLEGLVMGSRAAKASITIKNKNGPNNAQVAPTTNGIDPSEVDHIKQIATDTASVLRNGEDLEKGYQELVNIKLQKADSVTEAETANLRLVAMLVLKGALLRRESRGSHFRSDYPRAIEDAVHVEQWIFDDEAPNDLI